MNIQTLSICVPGICPNKCKFCCVHSHSNDYENNIDGNDKDFYENHYINRMEFARDNGCNTAILTGTNEPLTNISFLKRWGDYNKSLTSTLRAFAILSTLSRLTFLSCLSMLPMYVLCRSARRASSSCDHPFSERKVLTLRANRFSILLVAMAIIMDQRIFTVYETISSILKPTSL